VKGGMLAVTIAEASNCACFLPRLQQRKKVSPITIREENSGHES